VMDFYLCEDNHFHIEFLSPDGEHIAELAFTPHFFIVVFYSFLPYWFAIAHFEKFQH